MKWSDLIASSLEALRQRMFRTLMTILGVVIGTMAVIVMVSLGVGMSQSLVGDAANDATLTRVTVSGGETTTPDGRKVNKVMNDATVAELASVSGVRVVTPAYRVSLKATVDGQEGTLMVVGIRSQQLPDQGLELARGRWPTRGDGLGLVVGSKVDWSFGEWSPDGTPPSIDWSKRQLFVDLSVSSLTGGSIGGAVPGGAVPGGLGGTGTTAEVGGFATAAPTRAVAPVTGVLVGDDNSYGMNDWDSFADLDQLVALLRKANPSVALPGQPATSDGRPRGTEFVYSEVYLTAETPERAEELTTELRNEGYVTSSNMELIKQMQQVAVVVQAVFGSIGFISLLVAAIGIANTMMMSVYERTKQIGIMKVLGASLRDIRRMFLVESAFIGLFGGLIGLVVSWAVSWLMNNVLAPIVAGPTESVDISVIPVWLAVASVAFATAIGTLAGVLPAQRAMRLSPLAAIRAE